MAVPIEVATPVRAPPQRSARGRRSRVAALRKALAVVLFAVVLVAGTRIMPAHAQRSAQASAQTSAQTPPLQASDAALGRRIFDAGVGRDGRQVIGRAAGGRLPMQGGAVACANCHGANGGGGGEGWIEAPDIRWFALSKPYGARRAGGDARPPYDRAGFARALRSGIAADGVALDPAMPRFDLADDELDALVAHLQSLSDAAAGGGERPLLAILMPQSAPAAAERLLHGLQTCPTASAGARAPQTLPALRVIRYGAADDLDARLTALAGSGSVAALFAPYLVGAEAAFAGNDAARRLPVLLPMAMRDLGDDAQVLFALPGLGAQAQALLPSPQRRGERLAIVIDPEIAGRETLAQRLRARALRQGWEVEVRIGADAASRSAGVDAILALAEPGAPAAPVSPRLRLWVPAAFVRPAALDAWRAAGARVRIALPYPPRVGGDPRWIPPADAWVAVGCELMARLPPLPQRPDAIDAWRREVAALAPLRLGDWIALPADADADAAIRRVHLDDWPPDGR